MMQSASLRRLFSRVLRFFFDAATDMPRWRLLAMTMPLAIV